ncbi:MAG TPA: alpha-L-fucosidase [Tepidisphaeraceae bacterium]|nr:alpha-L-fucosidase [Tepidisphaeraceae bacterium]
MVVNSRICAGFPPPRAAIALAAVLWTSWGLASDISTHAPSSRLRQWQDAKLGLFIHFGPWSQTENGSIWKMAQVSQAQREEYFSLYKTFNPTRFDARRLAALAKRAGMKYVVFTTKHHDGFCNFDSALTDFKVTSPVCPTSASPHPDLTRDVVDAFRAQGLMVGLYYSHVDWHHPGGGWHHDAKLDPSFLAEHPDRWRDYVAYETGQVRELLTRYGPIDIFWFDIFWPQEGMADATPMLRMMRQLQPDMLINNRGTGEFGDFITPEQGVPDKPYPQPWETCMTISDGPGFWYKGPNARYKSTAQIVRLLADVASKGGNLLLGVGPKADGTLPPEETERLEQVGRWLDRNGQAIYGTTGSSLDVVPSWGRVTRKGSRVFLIVFEWPADGSPLRLRLTQAVKRAGVLGENAAVICRRGGDSGEVEIERPSAQADGMPIVVELELK